MYEKFTETTDTTEEWQKLYGDIESTSHYTTVEIESILNGNKQCPKTMTFISRDNFIVDLLDRFEILYGDKVSNLRRFYNAGHMLDILRIIGNEDLRKFVEERNYLSHLDT